MGMCNKVTYLTRTEARAAARRCGHLTRAQHAYCCDACGCWHLTSMSRAAAKASVKARERRERYENSEA